ncbi:MAG: hypothetical protein QXL64_05855 [Thermofilaceae archaeon]
MFKPAFKEKVQNEGGTESQKLLPSSGERATILAFSTVEGDLEVLRVRLRSWGSGWILRQGC